MTDRMWRTLVRLERVHEESIQVSLPFWSDEQWFEIDRRALPREVDEALSTSEYLHARVNLAAVEVGGDVRFESWEPS